MNRILVAGAAEVVWYGYYGRYGYQQSSFSNGGSQVDVVAPGRKIYSTTTGGYDYYDGTSMAAALTAGTVSFIWSAQKEFTGEEVKELLLNGASGNISANSSSSYATGTYPMICASASVKEAVGRGGKISGYFSDAEKGTRISASFMIHKETADGEIVGATDGYTSDADGNFVIDDLSAGEYVLEITKDGYIKDYMDITVPIRGEKVLGNLALSKELAADTYRIVMTWGNVPEDLDAHLRGISTLGEDVHIYYKSRDGEGCHMDIDDSDYYGPETVTITFLNSLSGLRYAVHNFTDKDCEKFGTNADALARSNVVVKVYKGDTLVKTYRVPANIKGTLWTVFAMDAEGNLMDINAMGFEPEAAEVLQP